MKSHDVLSNKQRLYLTSQNPKILGLSTQRKRIIGKVDDIFKTFNIILDSENIDQGFKDGLFDKTRISNFIQKLTEYDSESFAEQEHMKQEIIIDLMEQCMRYFQARYKEVKFIKKEIINFEEFTKGLVELSESQIEETEAQKLLKIRKLGMPPLLYPSKDFWKGFCVQCHAYTELGNNEDDVIKRIRHSKNCNYKKEKKSIGNTDNERLKIQFFKITPPKKKKNPKALI